MIYYLIFVGVMSIIALFLYGSDKRKAKKQKWRTKEAVLLSVGFFGGSIGALLGMMLFHHKTKHWYFWIINILGLIAVAAGFYIFYKLQI